MSPGVAEAGFGVVHGSGASSRVLGLSGLSVMVISGAIVAGEDSLGVVGKVLSLMCACVLLCSWRSCAGRVKQGGLLI